MHLKFDAQTLEERGLYAHMDPFEILQCATQKSSQKFPNQNEIYQRFLLDVN